MTSNFVCGVIFSEEVGGFESPETGKGNSKIAVAKAEKQARFIWDPDWR
ncbi:MAG: hypothetical protein ABSD98_01980 [Candidatus Korobacteraceae bacterium]